MPGAVVLTLAMAELPRVALAGDELDEATAAAAASPSSAALSTQPHTDGGQAETAQQQQQQQRPQHKEDKQSAEQQQLSAAAADPSSSPSPPPVPSIDLGTVDAAASVSFSPPSSLQSSLPLLAPLADGPSRGAAAAASRPRYSRRSGGASLSVSHHGPVEPGSLKVPRVYVGNLAFSVGWQDLKDFFRNSIGSVGRVEIISFPSGRSKGCAVVEFDSIAEAARAINQLNNSEIHGRKIFIREDREGKGFGSAASRAAAAGGGGGGGGAAGAVGVPAAGVGVGWLPAPLSPAAAAALQYGSGLAALGGGGGGLGAGGLYSTQMLQFNLYYQQYMHSILQHQQRQQQEAAQQQQTQQQTQQQQPQPLYLLDQFLQPAQQPSRPLMPPAPLTDFYSSRPYLPAFPFESLLPTNVASPLSPLSASSPPSPPAAPGCQLLLSNLPFSVSWQQLKELCSHYGDVVWADIVMDRLTGKSRGVGMVRFAAAEQAAAALEDMRGMELEGRKIHVRKDEHAQ